MRIPFLSEYSHMKQQYNVDNFSSKWQHTYTVTYFLMIMLH